MNGQYPELFTDKEQGVAVKRLQDAWEAIKEAAISAAEVQA